VVRVQVAVWRREGRRCRFLSRSGRLLPPRPCDEPLALLAADAAGRFALGVPARLARERRYPVSVRAVDAAGCIGAARRVALTT